MNLLTNQENNIAELIAFGFSEKEIASTLFIAESTVHTHARNLRKKINARSIVDVARMYILEHPTKFFTAISFLLIQTMMIVSADNYEMRKTKTGRNTVKIRRYEVA